MKKRLTSVLLTCIMLLSLLPGTAMADPASGAAAALPAEAGFSLQVVNGMIAEAKDASGDTIFVGPNANEGLFASGSTVTVKAEVPSGRTFTQWTAKNASDDTMTVELELPHDTTMQSSELTFKMPEYPLTLTASFRSSGGGGGSNYSGRFYDVIVDPDIENGTVTTKPTRAEENTPVMVYIEADSDYVLKSLTVTDEDDHVLSVKTYIEDERYSFQMPDSDAFVTAVFVEALPFEDVEPEDWFYEDLVDLYEDDLIDGMDDTIFDPNGYLTRSMYIQLFYNLAGKPEVSSAPAFDDVAPDMWYTDAVIWGWEKGVIYGYGNGKYGPDDLVTLEQAVAILYRYIAITGGDVSARADLSRFSDAWKISGYAVENMRWAVAEELVHGTPMEAQLVLNPTAPAERAQAASLIARLRNYLEK